MYLVIADRSYPRKLAFSYLAELSTEFARSYPPSMSLKPGLRPYAFVKFDTFIQRTKRLYLDPRGAEASGKGGPGATSGGTGASAGLDQLNEDLQDVTRIMTKNMEDLLWRGDSLDRMSTMSSSLRDESLKYRKAARKIVRGRLSLLSCIDLSALSSVVGLTLDDPRSSCRTSTPPSASGRPSASALSFSSSSSTIASVRPFLHSREPSRRVCD